jgi:hypothetical protein
MSYEAEKREIGKFAVRSMIQESAVIRIDESSQSDYIIRQCEAYVWSENLGTRDITIARSPWQRWKERCAPSWLKRLAPVKYYTKRVYAIALFPNYVPPCSNVIKDYNLYLGL